MSWASRTAATSAWSRFIHDEKIGTKNHEMFFDFDEF